MAPENRLMAINRFVTNLMTSHSPVHQEHMGKLTFLRWAVVQEPLRLADAGGFRPGEHLDAAIDYIRACCTGYWTEPLLSVGAFPLNPAHPLGWGLPGTALAWRTIFATSETTK